MTAIFGCCEVDLFMPKFITSPASHNWHKISEWTGHTTDIDVS